MNMFDVDWNRISFLSAEIRDIEEESNIDLSTETMDLLEKVAVRKIIQILSLSKFYKEGLK